MLRIDLPKEPYWIDLPQAGVRLKVRPLDSALYFAARSRAVRRAYELRREERDLVDAGARVEDMPDLDDPDTSSGYIEFLLAQAYAEMGVIDWEGVGDADGNPLPFDKARLPQLVRVHHVAEQFISVYTGPYQQVVAEKNGSVPVPSGTSAAGTPTASDAGTATPPAVVASAA